MKKDDMKKATKEVWKASETYTLENVRECGATSLAVSAGYLLRLAKSDPKCARRDERRAIVPLATQTHAAIWRLAVNYTAALPPDTAREKWAELVHELIKAGTATATARAEKARQARAAKAKAKAEEAKGEGRRGEEAKGEEAKGEADNPQHLDPVVEATNALIKAISQLPTAERLTAARRACSEIMNKFE